MLFSGKIPSYVASTLTARYWVPYLLRFATICHCSPPFALFETIRTTRYSLFATIRYSQLFAIRYSGFPDTRLKARRYPNNFIERSLTEIRFEGRRLTLQQRKKTQTKALPFVTTNHPAGRGPKKILMS